MPFRSFLCFVKDGSGLALTTQQHSAAKEGPNTFNLPSSPFPVNCFKLLRLILHSNIVLISICPKTEAEQCPKSHLACQLLTPPLPSLINSHGSQMTQMAFHPSLTLPSFTETCHSAWASALPQSPSGLLESSLKGNKKFMSISRPPAASLEYTSFCLSFSFDSGLCKSFTRCCQKPGRSPNPSLITPGLFKQPGSTSK